VEGTAVNLSAAAFDVAGAADPLTFTWTVTGPGIAGSLVLTGTNPSFIPPDNGTFVVTLVVDDGDTGTDTDSASVIVSNVNPSINTIAASSPADEGSPVTMTATVSDPGGVNDPITYTWSVTGPNGFTDGAVITGTNTFVFTPTDDGPFVVTLGVSDGDGGTDGPDTITVNVNNVPPDAAIEDPNFTSPIATGQPIDFTLYAFDPSSVDQGQDFTWEIDWNGDGSFDESVTGPDGTVVTHAFPVVGNFTIEVRATDHDVPVTYGASGFLDVEVSNIFIDANGNLVIGGTPNSDRINITQSAAGVKVVYNRVTFGAFSLDDGARILVFGGNGNDWITASTKVSYPIEGRGGLGNDTFVGGGADDTFYGEAGNDRLTGNPGNDTLDGGEGNDIVGGLAGDDYLLGGGGVDTITGGDGNDTMDGGEGNDRMDGLKGDDILLGGGGNDTLQGSYGLDILLGGSGNERMNGGHDHDVLIGEQGADLMKGDGGDDLMIAGTSSETDPELYGDPLDFFAFLAGVAQTWPGDMQGAVDMLGSIEDNDSTDSLFGLTGVDWFFVSSLHQARDPKPGDEVFLV
jgi:Ca2+-binding RTX toxin-like protein